MDNKLIEFLREYLENIDELIKDFSTIEIVSAAFKELIDKGVFTTDELRKELSVYLERIISINEFEKLLQGEEQWISQDL